MAGEVHGSDTYVSVGGVDLSTYIDNVTYNLTGDSHDVTGMGADDHALMGGLGGGQMQISGTYNSNVAGPRATLKPLVKTLAAITYRPEGTGATKPEDSFQGLIVAYDETSPVADRKQWACTISKSGAVTTAAQV